MRVRTNLEESSVKEASVAEAKIRSHTLKPLTSFFWVICVVLTAGLSFPVYPN
jgi:hypothetical protein